MPEDYKQFIDSTGEFSNRQLQFSTWYIKHRVILKKIIYGCLAVFGGVTLMYSIIMWGLYLGIGFFDDRQTMNRLVMEFQNYEVLQPLYEARDLQVQDVRTFSHMADKYDFSALVSNPNEHFLVRLTYQFDYGDGQTEVSQMILNPMEEKRATFLGQELLSFPRDVRFTINNIEWKRIKFNVIENIPRYIEEHMNFEIENVLFVHGSDDMRAVSQHSISFEFLNNSPYGYTDMPCIIELYDTGDLVGILPLYIEEFETLEKEFIDVRFGTGISYVSDIKVVPLMNIFSG
jgi:hypothetical protein